MPKSTLIEWLGLEENLYLVTEPDGAEFEYTEDQLRTRLASVGYRDVEHLMTLLANFGRLEIFPESCHYARPSALG
jgi:hypothetical protein